MVAPTRIAIGALALLPALGMAPATRPDSAAWRLRYINLEIAVDPARQQIRGVSRLTFSASGPAGDLVVDLADSMTVDSAVAVAPGSAAARGVREAGAVRFPIGAQTGRSLQVAIWYHGRPVRSAVGFAPSSPRVASFGIPRSARQWWPTADEPDQKADSADIRITAPATLTAASNGRLLGRDVSEDGRSATAHWSVRHPIYSDVVSFALADYVVAHDTVTLAGGRRTPLEFYVFPEDTAKAAADFAPVGQILAFYESRLGPYPFADEKYGLAEFGRPSFREGQTLTHLGAALITGERANEQVIAHEVAHQWFGNSLSLRSWEDMWLNESLSEFMAWQWIRQTQGDSAYQAQFDQANAASYPAPIAPADAGNFRSLFGAGTFVKGPVVVAMLRDILGERAFDAALRRYVADHAYGSVESADFERECERAWHKPLGWFFDQWIRGAAMPSVLLTWEAAGRNRVAVRLRQTQDGAPFRLPITLRITNDAGAVTSRTVWLTGADQRFTLPAGGTVSAVAIEHTFQLLHVQTPADPPLHRTLVAHPDRQFWMTFRADGGGGPASRAWHQLLTDRLEAVTCQGRPAWRHEQDNYARGDTAVIGRSVSILDAATLLPCRREVHRADGLFATHDFDGTSVTESRTSLDVRSAPPTPPGTHLDTVSRALQLPEPAYDVQAGNLILLLGALPLRDGLTGTLPVVMEDSTPSVGRMTYRVSGPESIEVAEGRSMPAWRISLEGPGTLPGLTIWLDTTPEATVQRLNWRGTLGPAGPGTFNMDSRHP